MFLGLWGKGEAGGYYKGMNHAFSFHAVCVAALAFLFVPAGCAFWSLESQLLVRVPETCGAERPDCFVLVYSDGLHGQSAGEEPLTVAPGGEAQVTVSKNATCVILAYPVYGGARAAHPLGQLYPMDTALSAEHGFAASIACTLYLSATDEPAALQDYVARFNWPRFIECAATFDDPWQLDTERILQKIASGTFKKSDLKLKTD